MSAGLSPEFLGNVGDRLRFSLRAATRVWGTPGIAAALLACAVVAFVAIWMFPGMRQLARLEARSSEPSLIPMLPRAGAPLGATASLLGFYKNFPPETLILVMTDQINQAADHAGVRITQADYRANEDLSGLARYEMSLAARGSYAQLRAFTAACLTQFPTLSLDGLTLSRSTVTDSAIDAQFRLSVYLNPR